MRDSSAVLWHWIMFILTFPTFVFMMYMLIRVWFITPHRRALKEDWFWRIFYVICLLYTIIFFVFRITLFFSVGVEGKIDGISLKNIWTSSDDVLYQMNGLQEIEILPLRLVTNIVAIVNVHIFQIALGLYFLILAWIMKHKDILSTRCISNIFDSSKKGTKKAIIRRETQLYINKAEFKFLTLFYGYCAILFMDFWSWISTQILDYLWMTSNANSYKILFVTWNSNAILRNIILTFNFIAATVGCLFWVISNMMFLAHLKNNIDMAYK